jgi:hypothetical protein
MPFWNEISSILMEKMLSEEGENALHSANVIRRYGRNGWTKKKMEMALKMINPNLKELSIFFNISPAAVEEIAKRNGVPISKLSFVCMLLEPASYFPMSNEIASFSKKIGIPLKDYASFLKEWRKVLHHHKEYVDDFLDLYMLLFGRSDEKMSDNSIVEELIRIFRKKDFLSLNEKDVKDFQEIYSSLLPSDKNKVTNEISDSYVKGVLMRRGKKSLIVDGSNIAMVNKVKADLNNVFYAFDLIGRLKRVPWPFVIVFDANFPYKLKPSQKTLFEKSFQRHPRVYLHSPADEKILEIASYTPSYILTNDRYMDYPKVESVNLRFDGKKIWEDRRRA